MNDDAGLSIAQFRDAWRLLCGSCPGYLTGDEAGMNYIFSGLPIPFFNVALVTADNISRDALAALGRSAVGWAADKPVPWMLMVTHEALAPGVDAAAALEGCGLTALLPLTGMRAHRLAPGTRVAAGLQLDVPTDDTACTAVIDVNSAAYAMDLTACKPILGSPSFWSTHVPALGRVDGTPVATAAVFMVDGHRYVALVATLPDQQRRGYGETVMRHALDVAGAKYGEKPTFLHATDAGRPVYARMGYETIATHTAFIENRFLEGH